MAKKTTKKNTVTPNPKDVKVGIAFDCLDEGTYFIMEGRLHQKIEDAIAGLDQIAMDSLTGSITDDLCDKKVIPVTVTIAWEVK